MHQQIRVALATAETCDVHAPLF